MSPRPLKYTLLLLACLSVSPLSAQLTEPERTVELNEVVPETDAEKRRRVGKAIVEAKLRTEQNMATAEVNPMFERAKAMQKRQAAYLEDIREGKTRRFAHLVDLWPQYQTEVTELSKMLEVLRDEEDDDKKLELQNELYEEMQAVGKFLKPANHDGYVVQETTMAEVKEEERLMLEFNNAPSSEGDGTLELLTPNSFFTLKSIPVLIQFSAPKGTEVFLFSELGGNFVNNKDYIKVTADDNGLASAWWVSHGDGVDRCNILFRSSEYPSVGAIVPHVKTLELIDLEVLSPVVEKAKTQLSQ